MDMDMNKIQGIIKLSKIDPERAVNEIGDFIINQILSAGKTSAVVGLSGGIDSTTVAYICQDAFRKHNKHSSNKFRLLGLLLPSDVNNENDLRDAKLVADSLSIEYRIISIGSLINFFTATLKDFIRDEYDKGNLSSEVRAILLSRVAAFCDGLILGTGNRDEDYCLGYFTKRGDGQVDISPIGDLSKRQVREVASFLCVPKHLVERVPTAGLWLDQTDEKELGFTYLEAEIIIEAKDQGYSRDKINKIVNFGYVRNDNDKDILIVDKVLDMHTSSKHKLHMPPVARVTKF